MKNFQKKYLNLKIDNLEKRTNYLIYLIFFLLVFFFVDKMFQNDTFYTIKIGQLILKKGIDFKEHFCFINNLNYSYPHFLYNILLGFLYSKFNFFGIYISTVIFTYVLILCLYKTNTFISNKYIGFLITVFESFLMISFFTARAQLISFSLFVLTYYFIEKYIANPSRIYALILIIIPILIANIHAAVFPFYFVIYLPYIVEYLISYILIRKKKKLSYFKVDINYNKNIKKLFVIFGITIFTGLFTPIRNVPYTYLLNIARGNSLNIIQEHLPLVLINNGGYLLFLTIVILMLIFTKYKITLHDFFFFIGMTFLSIMQTRQISMSVIFNSFIICKILFYEYNVRSNNKYFIYKMKKCVYFPILFMLMIVFIICIPSRINFLMNQNYVDEKTYPTKLVQYIKENIDYNNKKFFNEYNFGSYLLFNDIPVFIDSRSDLYMRPFNKFNGNDILTDYLNIYFDFDNIVNKYHFDYFIICKNSEIDIIINKYYPYNKIYDDKMFVLWKIENNDVFGGEYE